MTIEKHRADGFTIWGTDAQGYLVHQRYIGYTQREAKRLFVEKYGKQ
jgi:hypothetical protein